MGCAGVEYVSEVWKSKSAMVQPVKRDPQVASRVSGRELDVVPNDGDDTGAGAGAVRAGAARSRICRRWESCMVEDWLAGMELITGERLGEAVLTVVNV